MNPHATKVISEKITDRTTILTNYLNTIFKYPLNDISDSFIIDRLDNIADVAIFFHGSLHIPKNLYIFCSVSNTDLESFPLLLKELTLTCPNLIYGLFATEEKYLYFKKNVVDCSFSEYFTLPIYNQKSTKFRRCDLISESNLLKIFGNIHNYIYANDGASSQEVFQEIIKLLLVKLIDEEKKNDEYLDFYITDSDYDQINEGSGIPFVERINFLFSKVKERYPELFDINDKISLSNKTLANVVGQMQYMDLSKLDSDLKGQAFQKIIYSSQKGERGQFFTPDPVISFMVNMLSPSSNQLFIDPACGTGGFNRQVIQFIKQNEKLNQKEIEDYLNKNMFALEINPTISRVANLRFLLEGSKKASVVCGNSLSSFETLQNKTQNKNIKERLRNDSFDIILTNPPFGTQGKVSDTEILKNFNLGYKWNMVDNNYTKSNTFHQGQVPDILFIERCIDMLKPGGKLGIVLPNGDLENPSLDYVRSYILDTCQVIASIKLPEQTFMPFGTGVKASILFIRKKTEKTIKDYDIFFARISKLGYSFNKNATPSYKKDSNGNILKDENGYLIVDEDYSDVIECFKAFLGGDKSISNSNCYICNSQNLSSRLDFEYYEPKFTNSLNILKKNNSVPLSSVVNIKKSKSKQLCQPDISVRYVEISDVSPTSSEIISFSTMLVHELPSRASYEIHKGEIITSVAGNAIGTNRHASAIVSSEFDGCICTNGFRVLTPHNIDPYYLLYYLRTPYFLDQVFQLRTGAAIPSISDIDFANIQIYLPKKEIMLSISEKVKESIYLREKAQEIIKGDFLAL